ncbi:DNA topoisomerase 3 [Vagococcus fluvialis]|uniref:type IA DNA topoisomerase n=1 Tax=Vagococcus fluvialis TaxID=2738 RepID=UPI003B5C3035
MTTVILAEKPSQASEYAKALGNSDRKDGYYKVSSNILKDETYVTYGFGHLVELAEPGFYKEEWKKWSLDSLPIFPEKYSFEVAKDKEKQFKIVSKLLNEADTIVIATDSDREGENIAWSIIEKANANKPGKTFKRLWINSLEKEAIINGFENLKPGEDFIPFYKEAQTRQISDWLIGMNASILYTLNMQKKGVKGTFSIGRVQTPTLYMIYKRQLTIENFKPVPFFEIENNVSTDKGDFKANLTPPKKFKTEDDLQAFLSENNANLGKQEGIIESLDKTDKKTSSPHLFSLSSLQSKANAMYKATAKQTLEAVQGLYEAKLLTYPRTDTPYITENEFNYLRNNFTKYSEFLGLKAEMKQSEARKRYVDGSKVQEHHAIVLTKKVPTREVFEKLTTLQKAIYLLVAKTTVAMFLSDYEYQETTVNIKVSSLLFRAKGQVPTNQGWKVLFSKEKEEEKEELSNLPSLEKGQHVATDLTKVRKVTTAPKPYTEGTLLTAMKTSGKALDDEESIKILQEVEGIGTEATRASIIETLKNREYIAIKGNKIIVTEKGKVVCKAVENQELLTSAEMTAKWESYLKKIGAKQGNQEKFLDNIKNFISHLVNKVPGDIANLNIEEYEEEKEKEEAKSIVGKCPLCSKDIKSRKSFYGCTGYPDCKFSLADNFRGKKLTKTNLKALLNNQETIVKSIKSKGKSTTYNAKIKLDDKYKMTFIDFVK